MLGWSPLCFTFTTDPVGNREPVTFTAWAGEVDCGEVYGIH